MTQIYNDPKGGAASSIGTQIRTDMFEKKALIEAQKEQYFGQMASTKQMPKNMGKTIKQYHYLPMLDDANINDQGIDAAGLSVSNEVTIVVSVEGLTTTGNGFVDLYAVGNGANAAAALTAAQSAAMDIFKDLGVVTSNTSYNTYAKAVAAYFNGATSTVTNLGAVVAKGAVNGAGNLYGSSKDVGYIAGKIPLIGETGGRKNRVGHKRIELESSLNKYGFFDEYTKESMDFDSDPELQMQVHRSMINAANEMNEDLIQMDLLAGAGVIRYTGDALSTSTLSGNTGTPDVLTYGDLTRLEVDLDNNRCPKNTKLITGSRMVDTKVVNAARYLYVGSELVPLLKEMSDPWNNKALIEVAQYASAGTVARGEIGSIGSFRVIVVPEMMHWAGAGATVGTNAGYRESGGKYDVFPMLVVGDESFTTIGFQTSGSSKFKIKHVKPESDISYSVDDPYGEKGFMSVKWYYSSMILRPERIAIIKTLAAI